MTSLHYSFPLDFAKDVLSSQLMDLNSPRFAELLSSLAFVERMFNYKHKSAVSHVSVLKILLNNEFYDGILHQRSQINVT